MFFTYVGHNVPDRDIQLVLDIVFLFVGLPFSDVQGVILPAIPVSSELFEKGQDFAGIHTASRELLTRSTVRTRCSPYKRRY